MAKNLPIYKTDDASMVLMQTSWATILNQTVATADNPLLKGKFISASLSSGDNTIEHGLGRDLIGWFVVRINAASSIYDKQASNRTPSLTLVLNSSAATQVSLYVF